ncbi:MULTISPECIES: TIGR01244 family sulfur transferase [Acetobacter]|uniref:TIGR01244 family sulfur transferase n=1 Tax=Acetobacter thailandicus TaxID=1502842 RepID=A0ABT3QF32_9PROT|nr:MULTISPECIES: TIGR01244 family sulfur transferase [Acetobacter]MBS0960031.1 TIGR01244 family phosphatase [Acetobacter thailandicus]MBS0979360.1 TIGR01244 family phosphatase [Acetobacter thailandicus]MBS0985564.1 TIGR01244 family phosphatase [Acetobacter thailandicus]MBS1002479.1 TIGR01244 family phosphatase [Acetobacter thailandicus]MCX2563894.1 TIGR01244 family sulfur transferase [Acetobacter thailandicus]
MSHYKKLSEDFAVAPQISPDDVPAIRAAGFKSIICTRPDNEDPGQPSAETIANAATQAGLSFYAIPVMSGVAPSSDAVIEMQEALNTLPGPVFSYCRSGTRAGVLWQLATQK